VLTANRRLEEAEVMFQHALQLDPQSWMPYDGLAQLATANFRWGEARRLFAEATTRGPTTAGPYLDRGRTALTGVHGRAASEAAREAYEQATSLDPSALSAYVALSELAYRAKDYGESARWAGRGLQVDARDSMLRALLGRAQFATGDLTHARVNTQLALQECRDPRTCSEATALLRTVIERMPTTP
jgi:tetratricopeptide (TPR) repeat protein